MHDLPPVHQDTAYCLSVAYEKQYTQMIICVEFKMPQPMNYLWGLLDKLASFLHDCQKLPGTQINHVVDGRDERLMDQQDIAYGFTIVMEKKDKNPFKALEQTQLRQSIAKILCDIANSNPF